MSAIDRVIFSTECVTIGAFRCAVDHPSFRDSGPIRDDCFVFPRTAVEWSRCSTACSAWRTPTIATRAR